MWVSPCALRISPSTFESIYYIRCKSAPMDFSQNDSIAAKWIRQSIAEHFSYLAIGLLKWTDCNQQNSFSMILFKILIIYKYELTCHLSACLQTEKQTSALLFCKVMQQVMIRVFCSWTHSLSQRNVTEDKLPWKQKVPQWLRIKPVFHH